MTKQQKTLLLCSSLCYVLTIISVILSFSWSIILMIALNGIILLYFCYLNYTSGPAAEAEAKAAAAEEQYRALAKKHAKLTADYEQSKLMCEELEQERTLGNSVQQLAAEDFTVPDKPESPAPHTDMLPPGDDDPEPIDLIRTAADTIKEFAPFAEKAGIQLRISSTLDSLPVKADHSRIRVLFRNIIDNSIKYMNRAGSLVITISTIADDVFIVLKDNGSGLSEDETPHIFEMNYQGSNRISGNGLGLTQAKAIVEYYGGTIYAKSQLGSGMGIYIQIPMN